VLHAHLNRGIVEFMGTTADYLRVSAVHCDCIIHVLILLVVATAARVEARHGTVLAGRAVAPVPLRARVKRGARRSLHIWVRVLARRANGRVGLLILHVHHVRVRGT